MIKLVDGAAVWSSEVWIPEYCVQLSCTTAIFWCCLKVKLNVTGFA
jgi:hypothetical protein